MKEKFIPYKEVKKYIKNIGETIISSKWKPDLIISVNRGGCVPGIYLSHLIDINHEVLTLSKNKKTNNSSYIKRIMGKHKTILVIDDINDTGKTMKVISEIYSKFLHKLKFAVLIDNKSSQFKVDFFSYKIDKTVDNSWIVFPWESIDSE
tara:strand:+ start:825 stop:1274 length:450 start_codon:yes stop_codon:yes gene_type:complete